MCIRDSYVFDEEALTEMSLKTLITNNLNKKITLVLKDLSKNSVYAKMKNFKNLNFYSDTSYSIHSALKSDMLVISKKTNLFSSYMAENI